MQAPESLKRMQGEGWQREKKRDWAVCEKQKFWYSEQTKFNVILICITLKNQLKYFQISVNNSNIDVWWIKNIKSQSPYLFLI